MPPLQFPPIISRQINRLKRSLRFYTALDGIAALLLTVILLFVIDIALDRFFEFPLFLRLFLLPVLAGTIFYVLWQKLLRRCFAPVRQDQLASALEHFVPKLNESLITAVESNTDEEVDPELMRQTIEKAVAALRGVSVRRFFRSGRLFSRFLFSILCAALIAAGCVYFSETVSLWFARNILLASVDYPRRSLLLVDGFEDGRVRIGRGDSFTLSVRADMEMPLVPDALRVRVGTAAVGYRMVLIDQFRTETREGTRWRVFSTTFPEMLETVTLHIRGADSLLSDLCIEVVPTPTLTAMTLHQNFPDYMQRPERAVALTTARTTIPEGTELTITATSTKPLQDVTAVVNGVETSLKPDANDAFDSIALTLPALREETTIEFRLTDTDGLTNRHPIRTELGIIKDQPPVVTARLEGIGPAITPEAVLPIAGEITDDNGLATAISRYTTEPAAATEPDAPAREPAVGTTPITGIVAGATLFPLAQSFSVLPLSVLPDDRLILFVEAKDLFDLDESEGQIGEGPRWLLEIVTPEKLKTLLETREITLRQRFEVVIGEVERTKNILLDYSLEPTEQQVQEAAALTLEDRENETEENRAERQREWEIQRQRLLDTINLEQSELGKYHLSRMLRDTNKEVYDLTGIVESFRTIRAEMINNRIFTEDERRRIDSEIMQPMQGLINEDFPGIDLLLGNLDQLLLERNEPKRPLALETRQQILNRFDQAIFKMTAIRDKMASMESFSEAIELLRSIIKQQQQLRNETMEERNQRLRDLLE